MSFLTAVREQVNIKHFVSCFGFFLNVILSPQRGTPIATSSGANLREHGTHGDSHLLPQHTPTLSWKTNYHCSCILPSLIVEFFFDKFFQLCQITTRAIAANAPALALTPLPAVTRVMAAMRASIRARLALMTTMSPPTREITLPQRSRVAFRHSSPTAIATKPTTTKTAVR